jgi:hypothetical protein
MNSTVNRWTHPVHSDVINGDAPLGEQLLDVPVKQAIVQVRPTATAITSRGNRKPQTLKSSPTMSPNQSPARCDRPT